MRGNERGWGFWSPQVGYYNDNGTYQHGTGIGMHIVSEMPQKTIRTITRREIVPGDYGIVGVDMDGYCRISIKGGHHTPKELRDAAQTLFQIADFLEIK